MRNSFDEFDHNFEISDNEEEFKEIYKFVFIGDAGVGKTNLMNVFHKGEFDINSKSTIGVDFAMKKIKYKNNYYKI